MTPAAGPERDTGHTGANGGATKAGPVSEEIPEMAIFMASVYR